MKKFTFLPFLFFALLSLGQSQKSFNSASLPHRGCGTMEYLAEQIKNDPSIIENMAKIEKETENFIKAKASGKSASVVINIPVVFHVVYENAAENIPDYRLYDQLRTLNEDFRKLNADAAYVPSSWQGIAADCEINFCLAQRDPSGNPTTGITRTATTDASFSTDNQIKYTSQGGINVWDRSKYLNIWVGDLGGTLLGYAQFPGGTAATDGVVINYRYTGTTGSSGPYDKGRTATHEVGHWLNLSHIWASSGCSNSDQVSDTPNQDNENYNYIAPGVVITDACTSTSPGIMWMNYMDYTDDASMYLFTAGQKTRMQAVLTGSGARASLATSNGCTPVAALDASITAIKKPTSGSCNLTFSPEVVLTNKGTTTLNTAAITYNVDGGTNNTYNWSGTLTAGASEAVTLTAITSTAATHTLNVSSSFPNGGTDELTANDATAQKFVLRAPAAALTLPFTEGFQSTTFPPTGWMLFNPDANNTWVRTTTAGGFGLSSASTRADNLAGSINIEDQTDDLITPQLDFLSTNSTVNVTFNVAHVKYNDGYLDSLYIDLSTDCGTTWNRVYTNGGTSLTTKTANQTSSFTPTSSQWRKDSVSLSAYAGTSDIVLRFRNHSGSGNHIYLDDINVKYVSTVAPVANFTANDTTICSGQSVTFTDQSQNMPDSWSWTVTGPVTLTSSSRNPTLTFNTAGTYNVELIASNTNGGDTLIKTGHIVVSQTPSAPVASSNSSICAGDTLELFASDITNATYSWSGPSGYTSAIQNPIRLNTSTSMSGTYSVTSTVGGCTSTAGTTSVTISPVPTAGFSYSSSSLDVNFTNTSTGASLSYSWDFGDSSPADMATNPSHTYAAAGTYTVTLTTAQGLCSDTFTQVITLTATGIKAIADNSISIYPNPSTGKLTIENASQETKVVVYNSIGKIVNASLIIKGVKNTIDLSNNANGVYYIIGKSEGGVITKRITLVR